MDSIFIVFGIIIIPLLIMAMFLLKGKGAFLISGYNTKSRKEKSKYDEKALCRSVGWFLIVISFCMMLIPAGVYFEITWLVYGVIVLVHIISIVFIIYVNISNSIRKNDNSETPVFNENGNSSKSTTKTAILYVAIFGMIIFIVAIVLFFGEKEPVVNILDNGIQIKSMYGLNIDFTDITDISLIEKSMSSMGVGIRINGYGGIGETLKGNFQSDSLGKVLLFVRSKSSPTIQIKRGDMKDIYLSFRNSETTRTIYDELMQAFSAAEHK
jgi:hypothetical protein